MLRGGPVTRTEPRGDIPLPSVEKLLRQTAANGK